MSDLRQFREEEISETSSQRENNPQYRHRPEQIHILEAFFQECPQPQKTQREQLAFQLGLNPSQVKFWFQNKRSQTKNLVERVDNTALRDENDQIRYENLALKTALKNVICSNCEGSPFKEEIQNSIDQLRKENAQLREEHKKAVSALAIYMGKPIEHLVGSFGSTAPPIPPIVPSSNEQTIRIPDSEKALMEKAVANATQELLMVMNMDDPIWLNFSSSEQFIQRPLHIKTPSTRIETSHHSGIVAFNGFKLVLLMLDALKWANLFSTIVIKAETLNVVEPGNAENKNGCILLMQQKMHILSPLVPLREFYVLRHCKQLQPGVWLILDVSYDYAKADNDNPSVARAWKLPSGCIIQALPDGTCNVNWVERVEVDDRAQTHKMYRDVIRGAYGAERWVVTLQRMCEKLSCAAMTDIPAQDLRGVIHRTESRKRLVKLSTRMVKSFCACLNMPTKLDFPMSSDVNNSGVRVSIREVTDSNNPTGTVVTASISLWIPLPHETIFDFLGDLNFREKWDVLCTGVSTQEIANVTQGCNPKNCLKILRANLPTSDKDMVIIQETQIDSLGSMLVYAPLDLTCLDFAIQGDGDPKLVPVLPSGFIISRDGHPKIRTGAGASTSNASDAGPNGSLLTLVYQLLVSSPSSPKNMVVDSVASIHTLITSTVQNIKDHFNCS